MREFKEDRHQQQPYRFTAWVLGVYLVSMAMNYSQIFFVFRKDYDGSQFNKDSLNDQPTNKNANRNANANANAKWYIQPNPSRTNAAAVAERTLFPGSGFDDTDDVDDVDDVDTDNDTDDSEVKTEAESENTKVLPLRLTTPADDSEAKTEAESENTEVLPLVVVQVQSEKAMSTRHISRSDREKKRIDSDNIQADKVSKNLSRHNQKKRKHIEKHVQTATTDADKEAANEFALRTFVDLERDEPPKTDPWFVLHIGPPKTATTSIQCGLEQYSLRLAKTDGYHFLGGGCGQDGMEYYLPNGEAIVLRSSVVLSIGFPKTEQSISSGRFSHLDKFIARSGFLRQKGRSVILSSELFGSRLRSNRSAMSSLRESLTSNTTGAGFPHEKVRIVLAYRHFVDWLPSFYYQSNLMSNIADVPFAKKDANFSEAQVKSFVVYADEYLSNWEEHQRKVVENNFTALSDEGLNLKNHKMVYDEGDDDNNEGDNNEDDNDNEDDDDNEDDNGEDDDPMVHSLPKNRQSIHPTWWLYQLWSAHFPLPNQVQVYDMHSPMNSNRPNDDIVTNFVCNMLPDANNTCSKLKLLEDESENKTREQHQKEQQDRDGSPYDREPEYEIKEMHSLGSYLSEKPDKPPGTTNTGGGRRPSISTGGSDGNSENKGMSVRTSSDLHAATIVEELLVRGDIRRFDYSNYGVEFFETHKNISDTYKEFHKGHSKKELVDAAQDLLDEYKIKAPDEKYFDCMSKELEDRLLNASLTFVNLVYKHTQMLELSAMASTTSGSGKEAIEEEKEKRFQQALAEHSRLFEKNKAKGKYCDINPSKVFKEHPAIRETMALLSFKPRYRKFKFDYLPDSLHPHLKTLGFDNSHDWNKKKNKIINSKFETKSSEEKAAAFHIGIFFTSITKKGAKNPNNDKG